MKLRSPAVPLITHDPYFSIWSTEEKLNFAPTVHWTGKNNFLLGTVTVDGVEYSFLGYMRNIYKLHQISLDIDALTTTAVFEGAGIRLTARFTSPTLPDDYELLTRPVSYMTLTYESTDGDAHTVTATVSAREEICLNTPRQSPVVIEEVAASDCVRGMRMGNSEQKPLNRSGDDHRIDWGYFYLMAKSEDTSCNSKRDWGQWHISVSAPIKEKEPLLYLFAYDDIYSIEYFGTPLKSYWNRNGQTILEAITCAASDCNTTLARCDAFAKRLYEEAELAGGEKYAEICALAFRQVIAAHKLVLDENGDILYISKECFSNGCAATVDVSYPSVPMFLLYNPELVRGMLRPIYKFAASDAWKYDFAPHDVGQYPLVNGQVYGLDRATGELLFEKQMPVEECGNMLIMEAAVAVVSGDTTFAESHLDVLEGWVKYLMKYGTDPENQLCTDDFAGHLAHNCNLSLKAIMGIRGMAIICDMLGRERDAAKYRRAANRMAKVWMNTAIDENGVSKLAFDQPNTYSMKYNMIWDKVWGTHVFSQKFMDSELKANRTHFNEYGMPLDSRCDYTKSDWMVWTASLASTKRAFTSYIEPLWRAYNDSPSRVPLTDWFDTISAREVAFRHRSVQGGLFMKELVDRCKKNRTTEAHRK
ncbi:MAG: DUF4965 domain-containing protein [Clostridia bacterium]|nr:DUF4965 domain-containing protein [Clostridia bacterium]